MGTIKELETKIEDLHRRSMTRGRNVIALKEQLESRDHDVLDRIADGEG
jgi:hypothetical protein